MANHKKDFDSKMDLNINIVNVNMGAGAQGPGGSRKVWRHGTLLFPAPSRYPALREDDGRGEGGRSSAPAALEA